MRTLVICMLAGGLSLLMSKEITAQNTLNKKLHSVNQTIAGFFEAFSSADTLALKKYTTPDFVLLENGEVWNLQMVTDYFGHLDTTRYRRVNYLDFIKTETNKNMAWTAYYNAADITVQEKTTSHRWLESACLIREGNTWKIKLLHSTLRIPKNGK